MNPKGIHLARGPLESISVELANLTNAEMLVFNLITARRLIRKRTRQ
jgi:hypothetical protein